MSQKEKLPTYKSDKRPEEVLAEIKKRICLNNKHVGASQSIFLKEGPIAYKSAVLLQIKNGETQEHHHLSLTLQTHKKLNRGWVERPESKIQIDDNGEDEIGILVTFIKDFYDKLPVENNNYGVVSEDDYSKFNRPFDAAEILEDPKNFEEILETGDSELLTLAISNFFKKGNSNKVLESLLKLSSQNLEEIASLSALAQLQEFKKVWQENIDNSDEEFWQKTLREYSWSISQLFTFSCFLFEDKAYVGGKAINNRSRNVIDYVFRNSLTENLSLIEIKTPTTLLLGKEYRQTYSISNELSGGINQILNYKQKLTQDYYSIVGQQDRNDPRFKSIDPKCLLIVGNAENELIKDNQKEAFELYRNNLKNVDVITFDELFEKVDLLINILSNSTSLDE